jgi:hypothetical protein
LSIAAPLDILQQLTNFVKSMLAQDDNDNMMIMMMILSDCEE